MLWIFITIISYLILAIVFLMDKYLLKELIPNPKVYSFYVGILGILAIFLIPFVDFYIPETPQIILSLSAGALFILALFWFYKALHLFEASRIVPAIGGLVPIFSFGLVYLFSFGRETLSFSEVVAFILLIFGTVLITFKKEKLINFKSLQISFLTAFLLSFSFVLTKYVYLGQSFWNGLIWMRIGGFLVAFCFFLFLKEIREEIFSSKQKSSFKTMTIFLSNQGLGTGAALLQNFAIFLAPLASIALINALQGIQYAFLLILVTFLSFKFPQILKEEISKKVLFQKIIAILFIGFGLFLLVV